MRVHISPSYRGEDKGDGGIRRVVEAQVKYLPRLGIEVVEDIAHTPDVLAVHAGSMPRVPSAVDVPIVQHCHGLYWAEYDWDKWSYALNERVIDIMRRAKIVTAPSQWVADVIKRGALIDAIPIYHGIDTTEWTPADGGSAGYVLWNKTRVDPICDAEPLTRIATGSGAHFQYVSTFGPDVPNVKLTGTVSARDAKELVRNAGVYLCTSRETFGIGTLEALACGVPVVAWAWGGQREIIRHRENGWLCTPGDYDGLVEGIDWCLAQRDQLSRTARADVKERFAWPAIMQQYAELYQQAVEPHTGPTVSVVVPYYNLPEFVGEAVRSVLSERGVDLEVVIVDDKSPDGGRVCDDLAALDSRVRVIHRETNGYLAEALNTGIRAARGKYIFPLDADNLLLEGGLATLVEQLDEHPEIDIAYGRVEFFGDNFNGVSGWPSDFDYRKQMSHGNQIPSTCLFRRTVWARVGGYRGRCHVAEDADFWCRATSFGAVAKKVTNRVIFKYRNRPDSMSRTQEDWGWHHWYSWSRYPQLTPFVAPQQERPYVWTYEPKMITVVVPVGPGHERLLLDALDSLYSQTFVQWNCIVVNDTGHPLLDVPPWARVVDVGSERIGAAAARNIGFDSSTTRCVLPLDADDYLQPNALQALWSAYEQAGEGTYVYCDWREQETGIVHRTEEYNPMQLLDHLSHPITCLYERSAWEKVGGFDESLEVLEDWDFIIALNANGYCGMRVPQPLLHYRMQTGMQRVRTEREHVRAIRDKWSKYVGKEETLMACSSCAGRSRSVAQPKGMSANGGPRTLTPDPTGQMVLMEYHNTHGVAPPPFRSQVDRRRYYTFGMDNGENVKYVFAEDVPHFRSLGFTVFEPKSDDGSTEEPLLEARGKPVREEANAEPVLA